jgi:hypothetical protein
MTLELGFLPSVRVGKQSRTYEGEDKGLGRMRGRGRPEQGRRIFGIFKRAHYHSIIYRCISLSVVMSVCIGGFCKVLEARSDLI